MMRIANRIAVSGVFLLALALVPQMAATATHASSASASRLTSILRRHTPVHRMFTSSLHNIIPPSAGSGGSPWITPSPTINIGQVGGMAVDSSTNTLYVTNGSRLSVFDGTRCDAHGDSGCGSTPATAAVGAGPAGIAVDHATDTRVRGERGRQHRIGDQRRHLQRQRPLWLCAAGGYCSCGRRPIFCRSGSGYQHCLREQLWPGLFRRW